MREQPPRSKVSKDAVWTLMEKLSTQIVGFIVSMVIVLIKIFVTCSEV